MDKLKTKDNCRSRKFYNTQNKMDLETFFKKLRRRLTYFIKSNVQRFGCIKVLMVINVDFKKRDNEENLIYSSPYFSTHYVSFPSKNFIGKKLTKMFEEILCSFDCYCAEGSGWQLDCINFLEIKAVRVTKSIKGSNGCPDHDLPEALKKKKCILNVFSEKDKCFHYSIAAAKLKLSYNTNPQRQCHYTDLVKKLNCIQVPMTLDSLPEFELANNLKVNVFKWKRMQGVLLYSSLNENPVETCNLLLYKDHFYVIRNLNRFLGRNHKRCHPCITCFATFTRMDYLKKHSVSCLQTRKQTFTVPEKGTVVKFKNFKHLIRNDFVIYADFECRLTKNNKAKGLKTRLLQNHVPVSFGAMLVSTNSKYNSEPFIYHGKNVMKHFFRYLEKQQDRIDALYDNDFSIDMSKSTEIKFKNCSNCEFCFKPFGKKVRKCRDHSHILPKDNFRFTLCNSCNLTHASNKVQNDIPIIFHNLGNYDAKIIISALGKVKHSLGKVRIVPRNSEKYLSFSIGRYRFLDSYAFLTASLSVLVDNLKEKGIEYFKFTKNINPRLFKLLIRKQPYPYSFATKLEHYLIKELPPKNAFYDNLKGSHISDDDYRHAQRIFKEFKCKNFLDFHKLYLKTDICLLADVYEANRDMCIASYELDPVYYLSSSQFTMDAFLRFSGKQLECLPDIEMFELFERAKRGGISCVTKRFSQANNKYMGESYDENKEDKFLYYVDFNNLYGTSMSHRLPESNFKWVKGSFEELSKKILDTPEDSNIGYLAEVSLSYPSSIHDLTNDFPLAAEKLNITWDMLSPLSKKLRSKLYKGKKVNSTKLAPNLYDKEKYVAYYENIQYYVKRGMVLTDVHSVVSFRQSCWLSSYVNINTEKRRNSITKFETSFYKLLVNSLFGKLLEDVRKRMQLYLVSTQSKFDDLVRKPTFRKLKIFSKNLVAIEMLREQVELKVPIYAGVVILERSKMYMYKFHELMTTKLYERNQIDLLFTDTDSFLFEIRTSDLYRDLKKIRSRLDTSNYPLGHFLYSAKNKLALGRLKDEYPLPSFPVEFCGLKSKMYSILDVKKMNKMKAKGIPKSSLDKLTHLHYTNCLLDELSIPSIIYSIRSFNHKLYTIQTTRSSLNGYDDKRWIRKDGIRTYAHGHYKIKKLKD